MTESIEPSGDKPLLVCMLPVRNAEGDLPGYLDNVSRFCDAIVALDDGSTDGTHDILAAHPLVKTLLRNPPREGFGAWNDAVNRNRLLQATEALNPQWLIALDADERIDERDARALREFLQTDALPGFAYGFRHVPMSQDGVHFRSKYLWYYRLFAAMPGQLLPSHKLHFVPVPMNIPRERWIKTTLRIQHVGELSAARRLARFAKYLEADPEQAYEMDYSRILADIPDSALRQWRPRPKSMSVLLASAEMLISDEFDLETTEEPVLSAIVMAIDEVGSIERALGSVASQELSEPFEIIVVVRRDSDFPERVRKECPEVTVVEVEPTVLPGEARNAGLDAARGKVVVFSDTRTELRPGNLAARLDAHRRGYAMVTGAVYNASNSPAGWAAYLLDHLESLPGLGATELAKVPSRCSYARLPLFEVGDFRDWQGVDVETAANRAISRRRYTAYREPAAEQIQQMPTDRVIELLWRQFEHGRAWGRLVVDRHRRSGRMLSLAFVRDRVLEAIPLRLLEIEASMLVAGDEYRDAYKRYRGLVVLGLLANLLGTWFEILRPAPGKLEQLFGEPVVTALILHGRGENRQLRLLQVDQVSGETAAASVSQGVEVAAEVLGRLVSGDRQVSLRKSAIDTAVSVGDLHLVAVDSDPITTASGAADASRSPSLMETIATSITVARALIRGEVRSTLSTWQTIRLVRRLGLAAQR